MNGFCDLHTHTYYSDGSLSPQELVKKAEEAHLSAIALTDHNSVAGLQGFLAVESAVERVPGIEFTTEHNGTELHIIGLFVKEKDYPAICERLEILRKNKELATKKLVENLQKAGYDLDLAHLQSKTQGIINRAHIATELTEKGYTASVKEAFSKLLSPKCGYYESPKRPDACDTIRFIKSLGAVAILCHPFLNLTEEGLLAFLPLAKQAGLDAMETEYSTYDAETTQKAKTMAKQFGLLESGGSDFHGENKPDISVGKGRGNLAVPLEFLDAMRNIL